MLPQKSVANSQIKVLIVEKSEIIRKGLRLLLEQNETFSIVGETSDLAHATIVTENKTPDVVVYSPCMLCAEGATKLSDVREMFPLSRILFFINSKNPFVLREAIRSGAAGIVRYEQSPEILFKAINRISVGDVWIDRILLAEVLEDYSNNNHDEKRNYEKQKIESLTPREKQIIISIGEGLRNKEIALKLLISEATVRHHLSSVFNKLEVKDRLSLVIYAYQHGLVQISRLDDEE